jgi:hypothetical protein
MHIADANLDDSPPFINAIPMDNWPRAYRMYLARRLQRTIGVVAAINAGVSNALDKLYTMGIKLWARKEKEYASAVHLASILESFVANIANRVRIASVTPLYTHQCT